jgi:hypothetical protein
MKKCFVVLLATLLMFGCDEAGDFSKPAVDDSSIGTSEVSIDRSEMSIKELMVGTWIGELKANEYYREMYISADLIIDSYMYSCDTGDCFGGDLTLREFLKIEHEYSDEMVTEGGNRVSTYPILTKAGEYIDGYVTVLNIDGSEYLLFIGSLDPDISLANDTVFKYSRVD